MNRNVSNYKYVRSFHYKSYSNCKSLNMKNQIGSNFSIRNQIFLTVIFKDNTVHESFYICLYSSTFLSTLKTLVTQVKNSRILINTASVRIYPKNHPRNQVTCWNTPSFLIPMDRHCSFVLWHVTIHPQVSLKMPMMTAAVGMPI